jgi:hypothetical protein
MLLPLLAALLLNAPYLSNGYFVSSPSRRQNAPFLLAMSSKEADFSAFADSLEAEPPTPEEEQPWQAKLEDLMNPTTNVADRQVLLSELLSLNGEIRESVMDALGSRKVGGVWTLTYLFRTCVPFKLCCLFPWDLLVISHFFF